MKSDPSLSEPLSGSLSSPLSGSADRAWTGPRAFTFNITAGTGAAFNFGSFVSVPAGAYAVTVACSAFTTSSWGSNQLTFTSSAGVFADCVVGTLNTLSATDPKILHGSLPDPAVTPPPTAGTATFTPATSQRLSFSGLLCMTGDTATIVLTLTPS